MAIATAALANRGNVWRPRYIQKIVYADGRPDSQMNSELRQVVAAKKEAWDEVQHAMEIVVSSGTGGGARIPGLIVAGKTGTAQNPHGEDHAWFIVYAAKPGEAASIAIAVLVENGGHGGSTAAPVARRMILAHFGMKDPNAPRAAAPLAAPVPAPVPMPLPIPGRTR